MVVKPRPKKAGAGVLLLWRLLCARRPGGDVAHDPVWRLWDYTRLHGRRIVLGCLCGVLVAAFAVLGNAVLIKKMVDALQQGNLRVVTLCALCTPVVFLLKGVSYYGQVYLLSSVAERVAERLRNTLFGHMQGLSLGFFENRKTGGLTATIASDVPLLQQTVTVALMEGVIGPATVVGGVVVMLYLNWRMALVTIVSLLLIGTAISAAGRRMRRAGEAIQKSLSDTSALATEALSAIRVIQSFGAEEREAQRFREESRRTYHGSMRVVRINAALRPTVELLGATSVAFILWYGGFEIANERLALSSLMVIFSITLSITQGIQQVSRLSMYRDRIYGAAQRIFSVLDTQSEIRDAPTAVELDQVAGHIAFDNVHFAYAGGEPVLDGLTFEAQPGEAVALVGPSGVGKSTVATLIPRFYDVTGGAVRVDGHDVRQVTTRSLRAHIGIVAQETILFSGTIRENIAYGRPDATDAEITEAARAANAHAFIVQQPDGYDTVVGERGVTLSGGQRQRIAIARALLKDPRILILDEATSALDAESEALVQEALDKLMQGRTTIIIAHRLSTVRKANRILVLGNGRVQEQGSHEELVRRNGIYARLYEAGLGGAVGDRGNPE
ncbi:MAG: ABC transporter ATP-binding protein [Armatimonadetes bacterium]|nr:ABC transporter ATP-binding protein [Armatimonadota bacterium]